MVPSTYDADIITNGDKKYNYRFSGKTNPWKSVIERVDNGELIKLQSENYIDFIISSHNSRDQKRKNGNKAVDQLHRKASDFHCST